MPDAGLIGGVGGGVTCAVGADRAACLFLPVPLVLNVLNPAVEGGIDCRVVFNDLVERQFYDGLSVAEAGQH